METTRRTFDDLSPEVKAEIVARKEASKIKYERVHNECRVRREKRKAFRAKCHEGAQYLKQFSKDEMVLGSFGVSGDFGLGFVFVPDKSTTARDGFLAYKGAFCVKAPHDDFRNHVVLGLCGHRLKNDARAWIINIEIPKITVELGFGPVNEAIGNILSAKVLLLDKALPQRLVNYYFAIYKQKADETKKKNSAVPSLDLDKLAKALAAK
jgi:hypothetical protein